jgi:hypothetical protein
MLAGCDGPEAENVQSIMSDDDDSFPSEWKISTDTVRPRAKSSPVSTKNPFSPIGDPGSAGEGSATKKYRLTPNGGSTPCEDLPPSSCARMPAPEVGAAIAYSKKVASKFSKDNKHKKDKDNAGTDD